MAGHLGVGGILAQGTQEQRRHSEHSGYLVGCGRRSEAVGRRRVQRRRNTTRQPIYSIGPLKFDEPKAWAPRVHAFFTDRARVRPHDHETPREREIEMSDTQHVDEGRAPGRPDRRRPAARPLRPRVPWRHPAGHARHACRGRRRRRPRRDRPGHPADRPRTRPRRPVAGHYTLEVTSPGLERTLRTPGALPASSRQDRGDAPARHRHADGERSERRLQGVLVAADEQSATIQLDDAALTRAHGAVRPRSIAPARCSCGAPRPKPGKQPARRAEGHRKVADDSPQTRSSDRHEQSRHVRSQCGCWPTRRTSPSTRCCTCSSTRWPRPTSVARRRPTKWWSRSTPTRWSSPSPPTTSTRTATGSTSATTRRRRKRWAASPPRRSAR